jgi:hypothetical protein
MKDVLELISISYAHKSTVLLVAFGNLFLAILAEKFLFPVVSRLLKRRFRSRKKQTKTYKRILRENGIRGAV